MLQWIKDHWIITTIVGITGTYVPLTGHAELKQGCQKSIQTLIEVIDLVQKQSVRPPSSSVIANSTISGMLKALDAYSYYVNEECEITFSVGLETVTCLDGAVITYIIKGSSADKAGIQVGDIIQLIDNQQIKGLSRCNVLQKLSGNKNTIVKLTVQKWGRKELFDCNVLRDELSSSLQHCSCMLDPTIGFITIKSFTEKTAQEFLQVLQDLKHQGMKSLVLDLRDNTGGSLDAAIGVCGQLLGPDELIFTKTGRNQKDVISYRTPKTKDKDQLPIVVLINQATASASEVIAEAIQDHDYGLIIGQPSWGKGLIQRKIHIGHNKYLYISTHRYQAPSGRYIHKNHGSSLNNYSLGLWNKQLVQQKSIYKTDLGRIVYSNSGITPEYTVNNIEEAPFINNSSYRLSTFYVFALINKETYRLKPQQSIDDSDVKRFKVWLKKQKVAISQNEIDDVKNQTDIYNQLSLAIQNTIGNVNYSIFDPQIKKAMEIMPKAKALLQQKTSFSCNLN